MVKANRENRSKFFMVKCLACGNKQLVFENASTQITCVKCGSVIAEPTGGKATIKADILNVYK